MKQNNFKVQLEELMEHSENITENSELYLYIKQINSLIYSNGEQKIFEEKYKEIVKTVEHTSQTFPFLSVILRTQGNRPEGLRESLLCLRAQTCQDFEVILTGHNVEEGNKKIISNIINEQPDSFKFKINYIEIDGGTRTLPINMGFANAVGRYIAVYDDDDLLFDNWVEKFKEAYVENDGRILHAYALSQKWKAYQNMEGGTLKSYYEAIEAPDSQFCVDFDYLSQLVLNKCPLMGLAFPSYLFHKLGMIFNESLNVTEDWEYFMRVVSIAGIVDIKEATSIYRLWINAETSATLHAQSIWLDTYLSIQRKMNSRAFLIPMGYTNHIISLIQRCNENDLKMPLGYPKLQGILFYGDSYVFSDEKMVYSNNTVYSPQIQMDFKVPGEELDFRYFRIDPCEYGGFILQDIKIFMHTGNGGKIEVNINECNHNGILCESGIYFIHYDPQISWMYSGEDKIVSVEFFGNADMEIPENLVNKALYHYSQVGRLERKIKNFLKKISRR